MYMAARAGVEPTTLRLKAIDSTKAPPCISRSMRLSVCLPLSVCRRADELGSVQTERKMTTTEGQIILVRGSSERGSRKEENGKTNEETRRDK